MVGQRQLYQDGVHQRVVVEPVHELVEVRFGGVGGQQVRLAVHTQRPAGLGLVAHVGETVLAVAHKDDGQLRDAQAPCGDGFYLFGNILLDLLGAGLPVYDSHCAINLNIVSCQG